MHLLLPAACACIRDHQRTTIYAHKGTSQILHPDAASHGASHTQCPTHGCRALCKPFLSNASLSPWFCASAHRCTTYLNLHAISSQTMPTEAPASAQDTSSLYTGGEAPKGEDGRHSTLDATNYQHISIPCRPCIERSRHYVYKAPGSSKCKRCCTGASNRHTFLRNQ